MTVDGTFGAATRRAVIAWQEHAGLTVDGVVGRLTWQSIYDSAQQVSASGPAVTARAPDPPEETLKVGGQRPENSHPVPDFGILGPVPAGNHPKRPDGYL